MMTTGLEEKGTRSHAVRDIFSNIPEPEIKLEEVRHDTGDVSLEDPNRNNASLFNNPFYKEAEKKMDPALRSSLKKQGEYMYSYDYINAGDQEIRASASRSLVGIRSGLYISELSIDEIAVLDACMGKYWCEEFEMSREELEKIIQTKSDERNKDLDRQREEHESKKNESKKNESKKVITPQNVDAIDLQGVTLIQVPPQEEPLSKTTWTLEQALAEAQGPPPPKPKLLPDSLKGKNRRQLKRKLKRNGHLLTPADV